MISTFRLLMNLATLSYTDYKATFDYVNLDLKHAHRTNQINPGLLACGVRHTTPLTVTVLLQSSVQEQVVIELLNFY